MKENEIKLESVDCILEMKVFTNEESLIEINANHIFKFFLNNVSCETFKAVTKLFHAEYLKDMECEEHSVFKVDEIGVKEWEVEPKEVNVQESTINMTLKELQTMLIQNNIDIEKVYELSKLIEKF